MQTSSSQMPQARLNFRTLSVADIGKRIPKSIFSAMGALRPQIRNHPGRAGIIEYRSADMVAGIQGLTKGDADGNIEPSRRRNSMKAILFTTLAAAPLALADISLGKGAPVVPPAAPSQEAQGYITMAQDVLAVVKELSGVLAGVKDQASADAAAPQITSLTRRMIELQSRSEAMAPPSAAVEQQVRAAINVQDVQQIVSTFLDSFIRIGMNNGYGSQALLDSLGPVLNSIPGREE